MLLTKPSDTGGSVLSRKIRPLPPRHLQVPGTSGGHVAKLGKSCTISPKLPCLAGTAQSLIVLGNQWSQQWVDIL